MLTRRSFIKSTAALTAFSSAGCQFNNPPMPKGEIIGASHSFGHLIRSGELPHPKEETRSDVIIVGGGIAGLSAGWWLKRNGFENFKILELASEAGGNSISGENTISPYPWGAHYLPIPNEESSHVKLFLEEVGALTKNPKDGLPSYNEEFLCAAPQERLYINGKWQEGLIPRDEIPKQEWSQTKKFFELVNVLRFTKGKDGKLIFAIPAELSSSDPEFVALDKKTFATFLIEEGYNAPTLLWYLDYCARDDFGAGLNQISAWAGLHYFAGRRGGAANAEPQSVLTWPAGNGWLASKLRDKLSSHIISNALVFEINEAPQRISAKYFDFTSNVSIVINADYLIYSAPRFTAPFVIKTKNEKKDFGASYCHYFPWMVANLTLNSPFKSGTPAWDNVIYGSNSLGYVTATHQSPDLKRKKNVITYYQPFSQPDPISARRFVAERSWKEWCEMIFADLEKAHSDIRWITDQIDVWLWGHGMIHPGTNYIWSKERRAAQADTSRVFFAHSDMAGYSIFEEAQHYGVKAAEKVLKLSGKEVTA